jgi:excisionase family DNA binding protein
MESTPSPWLNIDEACAYARVGRKILYRAIAEGRCRAAHVDGRRKLVIHRDWISAWLDAAAPAIVELPRRTCGITQPQKMTA